MIAVVATFQPDIARRTMPPTSLEVTGPFRSYFVYEIGGVLPDQEFRDPIDGELLLELKTFSTQREAEAWIEVDIARQPRPCPEGAM